MKPLSWKKYVFRNAEFMSPTDLLQRAAAISVLFLIFHVAGFREFTGILNGTIGSVSLGWKLSAFLGLIYVIFYLAFVVLVPVLVLAAGMLALWDRRVQSRNKVQG